MKRIFFILFVSVILLSSCGTQRKTVYSTTDNGSKMPANERKEKTTVKKADASQYAIVNFGMKYLNTPYVYGGKTPAGFDCSGFTSYVYSSFGYNIPPNSTQQALQTPTVSRRDLSIGDLVFFEGSARNGQVGHVGIVSEILANGEFNFLHASTSKGVTISSSDQNYYALRYVKGGRVINSNNYRPPKQEVIKNKEKTKNNNNGIPANPTIYNNPQPGAKPFPPHQFIHIVSAGETFYSISRLHGCSVEQLKLWNPESKGILNVGDGLIIKKDNNALDSIPAANENRENTEKPVSSPQITHTISAGETLYSISRKYGCSVEDLKLWNPDMGDTLRIGDKLIIKSEKEEETEEIF